MKYPKEKIKIDQHFFDDFTRRYIGGGKWEKVDYSHPQTKAVLQAITEDAPYLADYEDDLVKWEPYYPEGYKNKDYEDWNRDLYDYFEKYPNTRGKLHHMSLEKWNDFYEYTSFYNSANSGFFDNEINEVLAECREKRIEIEKEKE